MLLPEPICESPSINLVDENASSSVTLPMRSVVGFDVPKERYERKESVRMDEKGEMREETDRCRLCISQESFEFDILNPLFLLASPQSFHPIITSGQVSCHLNESNHFRHLANSIFSSLCLCFLQTYCCLAARRER
ncbi:unnamed protein product [Brugia pahangi]|uniref:Ovule protein n=1 Tax=Brugia pahangi TaxID=6280 RepID=A0A0N4T8D6_BRUPA|nr:unnamed protein product [Brugia pahangi]